MKVQRQAGSKRIRLCNLLQLCVTALILTNLRRVTTYFTRNRQDKKGREIRKLENEAKTPILHLTSDHNPIDGRTTGHGRLQPVNFLDSSCMSRSCRRLRRSSERSHACDSGVSSMMIITNRLTRLEVIAMEAGAGVSP